MANFVKRVLKNLGKKWVQKITLFFPYSICVHTLARNSCNAGVFIGGQRGGGGKSRPTFYSTHFRKMALKIAKWLRLSSGNTFWAQLHLAESEFRIEIVWKRQFPTFLDYFRLESRAKMVAFWEAKWSQNRIQNEIEMQERTNCLLDAIWDPFWGPIFQFTYNMPRDTVY